MEPQLADLYAAEQRDFAALRAAEEARLDRIAAESQAAIDALPAGREKLMVIAIDELLSNNLGSADGYLGHIGLPATRKLQKALAEYGITLDYCAAIGRHRRSLSRA